MMELLLTHRGVTLGTALAGPENVFPADMPEREIEERDQVELVFLPFHPGPGYSGVQSICARAWQAYSNFGFLGPAADTASDVAGGEAAVAARELWAEIELRGAHGEHIPGRVVNLYQVDSEYESPYWLDVAIDRGAADVADVLPSPIPSPAFQSTAENDR